jgi:hypothetical protein
MAFVPDRPACTSTAYGFPFYTVANWCECFPRQDGSLPRSFRPEVILLYAIVWLSLWLLIPKVRRLFADSFRSAED